MTATNPYEKPSHNAAWERGYKDGYNGRSGETPKFGGGGTQKAYYHGLSMGVADKKTEENK